MRELVEQINQLKWAAFHHRWLALFSGILICAIGWVVIEKIPNQYQSETKVFLDTRSVLNSIMEGLAIDSQARQHAAQVMQQTLATRPNLEKVVKETDLSLGVKSNEDMEKTLGGLEKAVRVAAAPLVRQRGGGSDSNMYIISYKNSDPQLAKSVVDVLLDIFVESILGASRKGTHEAQQFLDEQIAVYERKQNEAEQRLKAFKQEHAGIMPQEGVGYYSRVTQMDATIEETKLQLREAENKVASLRQQINSLVSSARDSHSTIQTPLESRIQEMERTLSELKLQYTDRHPDVINTKHILEQLKQQQEEQREQQSKNPNRINSQILNSPAYQELNVLLGDAESRASALRSRLESYQQARQGMEAKIKNLPEVEAKLVSLNRDYEITKNIYEDLVKRRESSQLSSKAAQSGDELQFRIIEPPRIPLNPIEPNRVLLATMVMIAGVLGGIGIALLFEQVRPTFYTRQQVERTLDMPILGSVSMYWSEWEKTKRFIGVGIFGLVSITLLAAYLALLVHHGFEFGVQGYLQNMRKEFL